MTDHAPNLPPAVSQILSLLIGFGRPMTAAAVGAARRTKRGAARQHLRALEGLGLVCRPGRDSKSPLYAATAAGRSLQLDLADQVNSSKARREAKVRSCLGPCRRPFQSSWAGERLCPACKSLPGWQTGLGFE